MSCPDWRRLDPAARDASGAPHAAAGATHAIDALHAIHWREALSHLDSGCPHCWREALAVDPTLIFRRLPAPELAPAQEAEEVEAARLAVAAMRRLPAPPYVPAARWALAAGLTAMALVYGSGHGWRPTTAATAPAAAAGAELASGRSPAGSAGSAGSDSSESSGSPPSTQAGQEMRAASAFAASAAGPGAPGAPGPRRMPPGWAAAAGIQPASSRPSIEGLSRPEARVYQIDSPHMSVVMIVDGKLDV